jgi:hypothetical protein
VHYHAVDLRDGEAVARAIDAVRRISGRIDVLLHAAGLEISRNLPEKEPREFDLVFDVKSDGWYNLMRAARGLPVAASVVFSSVAGRFGNQGQTDYAAANDLLCKISSSLRRERPRCARWRWTGRPGAASAWPRAARSRRSWRWPACRCCRPKRAWPGSGANCCPATSVARSSWPANWA